MSTAENANQPVAEATNPPSPQPAPDQEPLPEVTGDVHAGPGPIPEVEAGLAPEADTGPQPLPQTGNMHTGEALHCCPDLSDCNLIGVMCARATYISEQAHTKQTLPNQGALRCRGS